MFIVNLDQYKQRVIKSTSNNSFFIYIFISHVNKELFILRKKVKITRDIAKHEKKNNAYDLI